MLNGPMVVSGRRAASPLQPAAAVKLDQSGEQYAVLLLNREQISQLLHQPSMKQVNRPVLDAGGSYAAYRRLVRRIRIALVAVAVLVAGASAWAWAPKPVLGMLPWARTGSPLIATGASFSLTMASFQDQAAAEQMARRLRSTGTAAFTRPVPERRVHQVLAGPYVSLDEAETQQRRLAARGFSGTRLFVDDTLRHVRTADMTLAAPQGNPAMVLVGAIDRASIALEMRSRPRRVTTRRPSGTTMEIEIGPLDAPVDGQAWSAPAAARLVQHVAIEAITDERPGDYARVTLQLATSARADTRIEGRRVYIDLAPGDEQPAALPILRAERTVRHDAAADGAIGAPAARPAAASARPDDTPSDAAVVNTAVAPSPSPSPAPPTPSGNDEALKALMPRFERLVPFLRSAAASPSADVLHALSSTVVELDAALRDAAAAAPSDASRAMIAASTAARRTVDPAFTGDRQAQAHDAAGLLEAARLAMR